MSESEEDDKSHPIEETGFGFRDYGEVNMDEIGNEELSNLDPSENEMLNLPEENKKTKKKHKYVGRDSKK